MERSPGVDRHQYGWRAAPISVLFPMRPPAPVLTLDPRLVLLLQSEGQRVQAHSHQAFVSGRRGHDRGRAPGRCAGSAVLRSVARAYKPARTGGDRRAGARSDRFGRFSVGRRRHWRGRGDRAPRRGRRGGNNDPSPAHTPCCHSLTPAPGRGDVSRPGRPYPWVGDCPRSWSTGVRLGSVTRCLSASRSLPRSQSC